MTMRYTKPITRCLAAAALLAGCFSPLMAAPKPNVILVLTDDQGYGDLSCHGNPILKTPTLDRLHEQSIRFTDFHVAPMCTPTRGELMTGRDALANGASFVCMGRSLPRAGLPTMASIFAANGYKTGHFGKWHLGDNYPYRPQDRGFQETVHFPAWGITSLADYFGNDYLDDHYRHNGVIQQYHGFCTDVWFRQAEKWIRARAEAKEPFFCYLPTNAAHVPLWVPERYWKPYEGKVSDRVAHFYGLIGTIDENMDRLLKMLEETGLAENTILIFMSDNGTAQGEKVFNAGMRGKKRSLYEGGHRVPFFIRWPAGGFGRPRDINETVETQDVLPTLISLCGLKAPKGAVFDGVSFAGLLRGTEKRLPDRMLVVQYGGELVKYLQSAVLWDKWRLVNGEELYDLRSDPGQQRDIAARHPEIVAKMRAHYDEWWDRLMPAGQAYQPITIGSDQENPVRLSAADWNGVYCDNPACYRAGAAKNGPWSILVARPGRYRFSLRRWPRESGLKLTDPAPPLEGAYGTLRAGKALPIARAAIQIGDYQATAEAPPQATEVTFETVLKAGSTTLRTWFYDRNGKELCGAYYVSVERLD